MISAEQARKQMTDINSLEVVQQLKKVEENIKTDIMKSYTYYYGKLLNAVVLELERLGYRVEYSCNQRDGEITTIRW